MNGRTNKPAGYKLGWLLADEADLMDMAQLLKAFKASDTNAALALIRRFIPDFSPDDFHMGDIEWEQAVWDAWGDMGERDMGGTY